MAHVSKVPTPCVAKVSTAVVEMVSTSVESTTAASIIGAYLKSRSVRKVAVELGVPQSVVRATVEEAGLRLRTMPSDAIVAAYADGESIASIARRLDVARARVLTVLSHADVERHMPPVLSADDVVSAYRAGETVDRIVRRYGTSRRRVVGILDDAGIAQRLKARPRDEEATLDRLIVKYVGDRRARREISKHTSERYLSVLLQLSRVVGARPLDRIGPSDVGRWLASIGNQAASSRRVNYACVKCFAAWLLKHKHVRVDLMADVERPKVPRAVPRAMPASDIARILEAAPDARGRAIVHLCVGMGLRREEVTRIEVGDWERESETMTVRGKGDHQRVLPVPDEVIDVLEEYLAEHPGRSGPLIRSFKVESEPISANYLGGLVSHWMAAAGVKRAPYDGVSAHALRHTAASDVLDNCGDLRVVQAMLGHQHLSSTSIYLRRAALGEMRDAMAGRNYRDEPVDG